MSESRVGSQRAFVAVTLITVLAVTTVFVVYAVILSTINGGQVTVVGGLGGSIWYDNANSAAPVDWTATLPSIGTNGTNCDPWYTKLNITSAGYSGAVTVSWTLQYLNVATWTDVGGATQSTSVTLTGSTGQTIYATATGIQSGNKNWGAYTASADEYRVKAVIETV